jgi:hypothetical protein
MVIIFKPSVITLFVVIRGGGDGGGGSGSGSGSMHKHAHTLSHSVMIIIMRVLLYFFEKIIYTLMPISSMSN